MTEGARALWSVLVWVEAVRREDSYTSQSVAQTYRSYHDFIDPMLRAAAAEARGLGADTLRWMGYADQELAHLRRSLSLPLHPGYAAGRPQYKGNVVERVAQVMHEVWCDNCDECEGITVDDREQARAALAAAQGGPQ